ncbi:MAG: hypothetical protein AB1656_01155 [Candidatus Omnitrophota bacterium]
MKQKFVSITILFLFLIMNLHSTFAQTIIGKDQIEDAYLLKTGGSLYGNVDAATSSIRAGTIGVAINDGIFDLYRDGDVVVIRSNRDIQIDPTNKGTSGAKIVPATTMEFPDFLGDKIRFYSHAYKIGVSPNDLDITSDRNIRFHSDTVDDLMTILGDQGDVQVKEDLLAGRDVKAGNVFAFVEDSIGDKVLLYGTLYRLAVSDYTLDFYSDQYFQWHSDEHSGAMTLDADTGTLALSGALQLKVCSSLPSGAVGQFIYLDHPTNDSLDGAYIHGATEWRKLLNDE